MSEMNRMNDEPQQGQEIDRLPLERYGLSHLEGSNLLTLEAADLEKLLEALGEDDISINLPIPCTKENLDRLLATAECRRCGRCCIPNPLIPDGGVEIFIEEIHAVARHLDLVEKDIMNQTTEGKIIIHPLKMNHLTFTRWLPLPCPFYREDPGECRVHPVRPVVCEIHPLVFTGEISYMAVKVRCDYGKDLAVNAFKIIRENEPDFEITL